MARTPTPTTKNNKSPLERSLHRIGMLLITATSLTPLALTSQQIFELLRAKELAYPDKPEEQEGYGIREPISQNYLGQLLPPFKTRMET